MVAESKGLFVGTLAGGLGLMNIFLQTPANLDIFTLLDKIGTIGVLVYIAYTLNQKLEKMSESFQKEEHEIRTAFLNELREQREAHTKQLDVMLQKLLEATSKN
jgi:hypothetical protein